MKATFDWRNREEDTQKRMETQNGWSLSGLKLTWCCRGAQSDETARGPQRKGATSDLLKWSGSGIFPSGGQEKPEQ